jgi:hypothetical protein
MPAIRPSSRRRVPAGAASLALAAGLLLAAGCGGDDDGGSSHDEREFSNAGITWWRQMDAALMANTAALDYGAGGLPRPAAGPWRDRLAPAHEYGLNCPDIAVAPMAEALRIYVVYGDAGCASDLTGQVHSGYVQLDVNLPLKIGTLTASNWTTGGYRVNGIIGAAFQDTMVTIDARDLMVTSPTGSVQITSCLGIWWSKGGTRLLLSDDSWRILGTADVNTLALESAAIYHLEVDDAAPVVVTAQCRWPVSGRLSIQRQEPPLAATLDFGNGACDAQARLTIGGRSTTIDLGNPPD